MVSFRDKLGREWVFDLTTADLKAIRQATGVEFTAGGGASLYDQIGKLAGDFDLMGRAVWALVEEQAKEKAVSYELFEKGLNRETIKSSCLALIDALLDFYHGPAAIPMKEAVRAVMEKTEAVIGLKIAAALREGVETFDPLSLLSGFAGNMPGSPGSTLAP